MKRLGELQKVGKERDTDDFRRYKCGKKQRDKMVKRVSHV